MTRPFRGLALILTVLLAAACAGQVQTASSLRALDTRLKDTLVQKNVYESDPIFNEVALNAALAAIAEEAVGQARETPEASSKVALYRIAAIAFWKAGEAGEGRIVNAVSEGLAACNEAAPRPARDCAVIKLALPFAQTENEFRKLAILRRLADVNGGLDGNQFREAEGVLDQMIAATESLLGARPEIENAPVTESFILYLNRQTKTSFCHAIAAFGFVSAEQVSATNEQGRPARAMSADSRSAFAALAPRLKAALNIPETALRQC
ncbi:MAG: hypothetical protein ACE363_09360 [Alphaproteobacteria bacterium]